MVISGLVRAWSFSLLGPREDYQIESLGYLADFSYGTKNLSDEFRLNIPTLYYAVAPEFTDYFGSNGIAAIDGAVAMLNSLTNADSYSSNLTEIPLKSWGVNYTAQAMSLFDLKSCALEVLLEEYGLADPEEFVWTLRVRVLPPGAQCPAYWYLVIMRNFDPVTLAPSRYINGNLFTYQILEQCPNPDRAFAEEYLVDPLATYLSAVASGKLMFGNETYYGYFHRTLTRDDIGGVRYLLSTNNINWETTPVDSLVYFTNATAQLIFSSNLQVFAEQALTNDAAALQALWPGLVVTGTSNFFVNVVDTNVVTYLTNPPYAPVGSPPVVVFATNYTTNVATRYVHAYANVLTNEYYTNCFWSLLTTNIAPPTGVPPGSGLSVTNVTLQTYVMTNCISGSFYILPTNVCAYSILTTQLTQLVTYTNFLTNTFTSLLVTNATGSNAFDYYEFSESIVNYYTNKILLGYTVFCDELTSLFEGMGKVQFVRRDYDSLLGQFFVPVSNRFEMTEITNYVRVKRIVDRTITQPDIVFSADDIVTGPTTYPIVVPTVSRQVPNYVSPTNQNVLGPGTIQPTVQFTFDKVGPIYFNDGPEFIDEATADLLFIWGSFDGTTNAPIVYPVGTDLMSLEYLTVFQMTNPTTFTNDAFQLPAASVGVGYSFQLEALGGLLPYTWSLSPGSAAPPTGLTISASGLISGTTWSAGIYDFSIRLTDAAVRSVDYPFTLTVSP